MCACSASDGVGDVVVGSVGVVPASRIQTGGQLLHPEFRGEGGQAVQLCVGDQSSGLSQGERPPQTAGRLLEDGSPLPAGHRQHEVGIHGQCDLEGPRSEAGGIPAEFHEGLCAQWVHRLTDGRSQTSAGHMELVGHAPCPSPGELLRHGGTALVSGADEEKAHRGNVCATCP
jgi:hypothetical protein